MRVVLTLDPYELSLCAWRREGDLSCFALRVFRGPTDFGRVWVRLGFEMLVGEWGWRRQWSRALRSFPPEGILVDLGTPEEWSAPESAGWMWRSLGSFARELDTTLGLQHHANLRVEGVRELAAGFRVWGVEAPLELNAEEREGLRSMVEAIRDPVPSGSEEECIRAERLTALAQATAEPPLSFCSDCPGRFRPEDLFIGKKTSTPLCEGCLDRRVRRGAAKRPAEF